MIHKRRAKELLGTLVSIEVQAHIGARAHAAIDSGFRQIELIQKIMSIHDPKSQVSAINSLRSGEKLLINPGLYQLLTIAQQISIVSEGAFDITVGNILMQQGIVPSHTKNQAFGVMRGYEAITLLPDNYIMLKEPRILDLGGIAKGFAIDCAIQAIKDKGVLHAIVNAGGDLRIFSETAQPISVRDPSRPDTCVTLAEISNGAVATSAGYFYRKSPEDDALSPFIDPRSGKNIDYTGSVSVFAETATVADALTKVLIARPTIAAKVLKHFCAQAVMLGPKGELSYIETPIESAMEHL